MTRQAVAKALEIELKFHPEGIQILQSRAKHFDGGLTEQRKRMVEFPVGARLIPNPVNKVPGFSIHQHYFVPGFPKMAQPMIQWVMENHYSQLNDKEYREWSINLYKVPESDIADLMSEIQQQHSVKVFSLPRMVDSGYQIELGLKGNKLSVSDASEQLISVLRERGYRFEE